MSAQDYFHEKAEESRHNEMVGYIMFLAGSVFFVGGILTALSMGGQLNWFVFIPYSAGSGHAMGLEMSFLVVGMVLIVLGIGCGLHFNHDRSMYMRELCEAKNEDNLLRDFRAQKNPVKNKVKRNSRA
jgi:hypothetical protein